MSSCKCEDTIEALRRACLAGIQYKCIKWDWIVEKASKALDKKKEELLKK